MRPLGAKATLPDSSEAGSFLKIMRRAPMSHTVTSPNLVPTASKAPSLENETEAIGLERWQRVKVASPWQNCQK